MARPEDIVRVALDRDLDEVVFTEHLEFIPPPDFDEPAYIPDRVLDAGDYLQTLKGLRERWNGRIHLGMGVELGLERHNLDAVAAYIRSNEPPLDFVLGSLHSVGGSLVQLSEFTDTHGPAGAARLYFERLLAGIRRAADLEILDAVGHLDLVKRSPTFGPFRLDDYRPEVEAVLRELVGRGIGLEVNTSGYRQSPREPYPGLETLRLYREMGGEIVTVGSDSHRAETVGREATEALSFLRAAGFDHLTVFRGRRPGFRPI